MSAERVLAGLVEEDMESPWGPWRAASAVAPGYAHIAAGTDCQDAAVCRVLLGGEVLCAAVSDGAGTAPMSGVGAAIASGTLVTMAGAHVVEHGGLKDISRETVDLWIGKIQEAIESEAAGAGRPVRDYSCTLLGMVAHGNRLATLQVGDGAMAIGNRGEWRYVYWPQHGQYANETFFVTEMDVWDRLKFDVTDIVFDEVGLFSDGLERLLLNHAVQAVHGPFFQKNMTSIRNLEKAGVDDGLSAALAGYLGSDAVNSRTDDDKSLILATRRPTAGAVSS